MTLASKPDTTSLTAAPSGARANPDPSHAETVRRQTLYQPAAAG